jgi:hypothetical protein
MYIHCIAGERFLTQRTRGDYGDLWAVTDFCGSFLVCFVELGERVVRGGVGRWYILRRREVCFESRFAGRVGVEEWSF